ncbi:uncharacterized protein LOC110718054 isoform X1 [Chenopodium quinoa]|uniref:uncharacterized protein LOC110718054 isoform X1 n=1 Tax=Chenopodium quinoa TaxID=63459 RepID=UPI000B77D242|nr:uncharacterized protein LOC110718054 isoform X1 [Chenopodium quinoa]
MAAAGSIGLLSSSPMFRSSPCLSQLKASSSSSSCNSLSPQLLKTISDIHSSGIIACLRAPSAELALGAARAALRGGIQVLEVVMSTPGVFEVLQQLVLEYPTMTLGVGTVLNVEDAKVAKKVGAKFLMSPAMIKLTSYLQDILAEIQDHEVLYIPGVMTPTEILSAYNAGARIVKVYPVSALGGVEYISAVKKPFHHIPMVASQGIQMGLVADFITRGASAVVLSDAIFQKEAVARGDFDSISERAQLAVSIGTEAKNSLN